MLSREGLTEATAGLLAAVESACGGPRAMGDDPADLNELRTLLFSYKRLEALVADRLQEAAERDLCKLEGWPLMSQWAQSEMLMDRNDVNALMRASRVARTMPTVGGLWRDGWFSTTHVRIADDAVNGFTEEQRAHADEFLAREAANDTVPAFSETCHDMRETLVPDLVADELDRARLSSHVTLRPVDGGRGRRISGVVYGEDAERIQAGIDRFSARVPDDNREAPLRRAQGLGMALGIAARADIAAREVEGTPYEGVDLPPVRIQTVVDLRALQRALDRDASALAARLADPTDVGDDRPEWRLGSKADLVKTAVGERTRVPIDWRSVAMRFCDGEVQRLVLGPESEVLDLGRRARLFSASQRQAMLRGRGRCQWRNCDSPWVEADHVTRWVDGGKTSVDDGRMLCEFHHRMRHQGWVLTACDDGTYAAQAPPDWAEQCARSRAAQAKVSGRGMGSGKARKRTAEPRVA